MSFYRLWSVIWKKERKAVVKITKYYRLRLETISIKNVLRTKKGAIPGRNALLYFTALMNFKKKNGLIASGIHFGTPYYDCSQGFITNMQSIFDQYSQGTVKIAAPFLKFNNKEIYDYCLAEKVPLELTYSCELGKKQPCGICPTCMDLLKINARQNN